MVQQTTRETTAMANNVSEVMSLSPLTLTPGHVFTPTSQETSGDMTFESGSHLQIHPQITLSCADLSTRGPRTGSSEAVFSGSGSPPPPFSGFMASVCHLPRLAAQLSDVTFHYSGLREERHLVRCLVYLFFG